MNAPSPIAAGGSAQISHAHRNALGEGANSRDFRALMDSLAEKEGVPKKVEAHDASSLSGPKPNASATPAPSSPLRDGSSAPAQVGVLVRDSLAQGVTADADPALVAKMGDNSRLSKRQGTERQVLAPPGVQMAGALYGLVQAHGADASPAWPALSSKGDERPPSAAVRDAAAKTGGESDFSDGLGAELQSLFSDMQTRGAAMAPARDRSADAPSAFSGISSNGQEEPISVAFSSVANEMQLRVTRATAHFDSFPAMGGRAALQQKTTVVPSIDEEAAQTSVASPASSAEPASGGAFLDARASNDAGPVESHESADPPALIFADVPFPLVPQTLGQAAATLEAAQAPSTGAASGVAGTIPHASGAMTRELEIHLSPSGLGSLLVKMKLSEGALSVVIEASKPSTLNAVESARNDIVERLAATSQVAASLEVKPLHVSPAQSEDVNAGFDGPPARDHSRGQSDAEQNLPDRRRERESFRVQEQSPLGGAGHLVL